jgi:hypothetical protein
LIKFVVNETHLKLVRRLNFGNSRGNGECGAPEIDTKRPYGNSDIYRDMADIVGIPQPDRERDEEFTLGQFKVMDRLNYELPTVLEIGVITGAFVTGEYVASGEFARDWKRIEP